MPAPILAEESLVQIRDSADNHVGVGFVIARGLVATNAHVASRAATLWSNGTRYACGTVTCYPASPSTAGAWPMPDLAEIEVSDLELPPVLLGRIRPEPFLDLPIATYHPGFYGSTPDRAQTLVQYLRLSAAGQQWQISNDNNTVEQGMSGSPVVDAETGKVCGVVKASAASATRGVLFATGGWVIPLTHPGVPQSWFGRNRADNPYGNSLRTRLARTDEVQARLFQPDKPPLETTPANMLDAETGFAPFEGSTEYRELLAWCSSEADVAVRLVFGTSGAGKSRTAIQVCRELKNRGWVAGFPGPMTDQWFARLDEALRRELRVCIVVDDAEHRIKDVTSLLLRLQSIVGELPVPEEDLPLRVRILLLTRTEPDWFEDEILVAEGLEHSVAHWIGSVLTPPMKLRPLPLDDKSGALDRAFRSYADRLGVSRSVTPVWSGTDALPTTLDLYAVAADAALSHYFDDSWQMTSRADPLKAIRDHQLRFWFRRLKNAGYALRPKPAAVQRPKKTVLRRPEPDPVVVPPQIAEAWLLVPTLAAAADPEHLRRVMNDTVDALGAPGREDLNFLYGLYPAEPSTEMPAMLSPDRLAELMFREVCESLGEVRLRQYLAAVLWLTDGVAPSGPVPGSAHPTLRLIARARGASEITPADADEAYRKIDVALEELLAAYPAKLMPELTKLCGELPNAGALVAGLTVAAEICDLALLEAVEAHLSDDGRGLSPLALTVYRRQLAAMDGTDDESLSRRIRWERSLSLHQEHLRMHDEALRTNENAINECRVLITRGAGATEMFAQLHGDRALFQLRRNDLDEAMANGEIAIREYRSLGSRFGRALADVLHNQGILYHKNGRLLQALEAGNEAIRRYEDLAPRRSRAAAQLRVSDYLGELGRPAESLVAAEMGVALMEGLYAEAASSHAADYMRAQFQLAMALYGVSEEQERVAKGQLLQRALDALNSAVRASRHLPVAEPQLLRLVKGLRDIVREELENDEPMSGELPASIRRQRVVSVFQNEYGELFNDEVVSPSGASGRYLRWRWSFPGVVAVPVADDRVALVPAYRYPAGAVFLEFPRGAANAGEPVESAALRELEEESGLSGRSAQLLGTIFPETGLVESDCSVVRVEVSSASQPTATPEAMESVGAPRWFGRDDLRRAIRAGDIRCGVTLAALGLLWATQDPS